MFPDLILLHEGFDFFAPDYFSGFRGLGLMQANFNSKIQGEEVIKYHSSGSKFCLDFPFQLMHL